MTNSGKISPTAKRAKMTRNILICHAVIKKTQICRPGLKKLSKNKTFRLPITHIITSLNFLNTWRTSTLIRFRRINKSPQGSIWNLQCGNYLRDFWTMSVPVYFCFKTKINQEDANRWAYGHILERCDIYPSFCRTTQREQQVMLTERTIIAKSWIYLGPH